MRAKTKMKITGQKMKTRNKRYVKMEEENKKFAFILVKDGKMLRSDTDLLLDHLEC